MLSWYELMQGAMLLCLLHASGQQSCSCSVEAVSIRMIALLVSVLHGDTHLIGAHSSQKMASGLYTILLQRANMEG